MIQRLVHWAVVGVCLSVAPVHAGVTDDVQSLVDARRYDDAYVKGKLAPDALGEARFDFFWGVAAIESGHPGEGVLALQRYLLRHANDEMAQFLLARGYFALGEDDAAAPEFAQLANSANVDIATAAKRFLAAMAEREAGRRSRWSGYLGVALGYDDNITSGIARGALADIPGFGVLPAQPDASTGVAAADAFASFNGGLGYQWVMAPTRRVILSATADHRQLRHDENRIFDQQNLRGDATYVVESGTNTWRASIAAGQSWIDQRRYMHARVLGGDWTRAMGERDRLTLGLQAGVQRYAAGCSYFLREPGSPCVASNNTERDSRIASVGAGWAHAARGAWSPLVQVGVTAGREANEAGQPALSRDLAGVRAGVRLSPASGHLLSLAVGWQASRYDDKYPAASVDRRDDLTSVEASWHHRIDQRWLLMVDATAATQASNIGLYDYDRATLSVGLRHHFD